MDAATVRKVGTEVAAFVRAVLQIWEFNWCSAGTPVRRNPVHSGDGPSE